MEKKVIVIRNVKKQYKLGQIGGGTLQGDLQSWWARKHGKEDPNSKIGTEQRLVGKTFMALNGINLEIKQGEAVGIIGKNGAGKSTLLKLLSRVTAPTEGTIDIWGRITSMLEVGTGFHGEMTGRENVYMNGAILGMSKNEIDKKIQQIIDFSEVGDFIDTPVKRYSSGMYVKLAFSVAAHLDSEIMIMDEVLAVGDVAFQKKCLDKMNEATRVEGKTVLYVSHNMNTIRDLCTRCIVMDEGRVAYDGEVDKAIEIYMNSSWKNARIFKYEKNDHTQRGNKDCYLQSLSILNQETNVITQNGIFKLRVDTTVRKKMENVRIRLEIQYGDGTVAGAVFSDPVSVLDIGERSIYINLDLAHLAPGEYKADMVIYITDERGNDNYIDGVIPAFYFAVSMDTNCSNNMEWLHRYWGHTRFTDMIIEKVE